MNSFLLETSGMKTLCDKADFDTVSAKEACFLFLPLRQWNIGLVSSRRHSYHTRESALQGLKKLKGYKEINTWRTSKKLSKTSFRPWNIFRFKVKLKDGTAMTSQYNSYELANTISRIT